ncbi:S8 family serine peptidase [Bacillota bacterium LX-D]|nr:S8 family serine peptidase [Bacillota bacterium LX-D]
MKQIRRYALVILLIHIFCVVLSPKAYAFSDVGETNWASQGIDYANAKDIVKGYGDGRFMPYEAVTRSEFAVMLIKALNMKYSVQAVHGSAKLFRDVPGNHWAKDYIQLAWELGIVSGYADGTFRPDQKIRRDEMVSTLVRALRYIGQGEKNVQFKDLGQIPAWSKDSVLLAARWGLVGGFADGTFRASSPVTRAQAAVFINNFLDQRKSRFDYYGLVKKVQLTTKTMDVELQKETTTFTYSGQTVAYRQGKKISLQELRDLAPCNALFVLTATGEVGYLEVVEQKVPENLTLTYGFQEKTVARKSVDSAASKNGGKLSLDDDSLQIVKNELPVTAVQAGKSLNITKNVMGVSKFADDLKVDGRGQTIAIIDSGVDPLHPDLQKTTHGEEKIVDFIDLSKEGEIDTKASVGKGQSITFNQKNYLLGTIPTQSGIYHYGFLQEGQIDLDINFDGQKDENFLVVVTDRVTKGKYDTVYVDTNGNGSLIDEPPSQVYSQSHGKLSFKSAKVGSKFGFVVSGIASTGQKVNLGFDANGHGTQVAGVAAANGTLQGVAPGAKLLIIKVLDKQGETDWDMLEEAVRVAAAKKANIVNLSLGYYQDNTFGNNTLTYLIDNYSKQNNMFFIAAAGNKGPGIGSLATPGNAKGAIGVGAYISPEMWESDYGWNVEKESLWYFSSMGPRQDGMVVPTIVAPGSAISCYPTWSGTPYKLAEGTSIAAPHVAGAAALLLTGANQKGLKVSPDLMKKALANGAKKLSGFNEAEEGYGLISINQTWKNLAKFDFQSTLASHTWNKQLGIGEGLYAREYLPRQVPFLVKNTAPKDQVVFWSSTADWLKPWFKMTSMPKGSQRELPVDYELPDQPGIYTAFLNGRFLSSPGPEVSMLTTVIKPSLLNEDNNYRVDYNGILGAAQFERYFFKVPEGTGSLEALLNVPEDAVGLHGQVRMHLIKPDGQEYAMSEFAGKGFDGSNAKEWVAETVPNPDAGTWEVVVYSSPALEQWGLRESCYKLKIQLFDVEQGGSVPQNFPYLVGVVSRKIEPNKPNYISISVRDKKKKTPIDDVMLEINGQMYRVKKGWVTFTTIPQSTNLELDVKI